MNKENIPTVLVKKRKDGIEGYEFKCPYCKEIHCHGLGEGHRNAHCSNPNSLYLKTGYILKEMGKGE